jgi:putative IMPACT (imprinted ancient) family translation regulator
MDAPESSTRARGNLDSFITRSKPSPEPAAKSQEIRDRSSTFFAHLFRARSPQEAQACIKYLKNVLHGDKPASHEIAAWRCMTVKKGATGLGGPDDFEIQTGFDDDGEKWGGSRILKVMQNMAVIDAVIIVTRYGSDLTVNCVAINANSRYYGGIMLGPARFTHIET